MMGEANLRILAEQEGDVFVSPASRWSDAEWRFPVTVAGTRQSVFTVRWAFEVDGDAKLTDPKCAELLESWKRVVWCLLTEPGDGQARTHSVCSKLNSSLRSIVPFMVASGRPDLSHIDHRCFREYREHITREKVAQARRDAEADDEESGGITSEALCPYFALFTYAWWARDSLARAGLPHPGDDDPLDGRAAIDLAREVCRRVADATPEIPDRIFVPTINMAATLIDRDFIEPLIELCNEAPNLGKDELQRRCLSFVLGQLDDCNPHDPPSHSVRAVLARVRTACGILVQGLSGIRVSELCGIPAGTANAQTGLPSCVVIERAFDDEYEIFLLDANLFKNTGSLEPVQWILGLRPTGSSYLPLPVRALDILHRIDAGWRAECGVAELLVNFTSANGLPSGPDTVVPMMSSTVRYWQQRWLEETGHLEVDDRLTSHMWRKTFGRYMVRASAGLLPAISHHFKHMSVAFTEVGYCQPRTAAREIIKDARVAEAGHLILGVITGERPVEGPIAAELRELSREMKGRFANRGAVDLHRDVTEAARIRHIQVYRADFGVCVFRGDGARCHELAGNPRLPLLRLAPAFAQQTADICSKCRNFGISADHKDFWRTRLATFRQRLAACGADAPAGLKSALGRQCDRCTTVLEWMEGQHGAESQS